MNWLFVLFFLFGAIDIQIGNGWQAKNGVTLSTFIIALPPFALLLAGMAPVLAVLGK